MCRPRPLEPSQQSHAEKIIEMLGPQLKQSFFFCNFCNESFPTNSTVLRRPLRVLTTQYVYTVTQRFSRPLPLATGTGVQRILSKAWEIKHGSG